MTKKVHQQTRTDCGLACMAMAANLTYEEAYRHFDAVGLATPRARKPAFATNFTELRSALSQAGIPTRVRRYQSLAALPSRAILKVNVRPNGDWHWVFVERENENILCVFDPARKGPSYTPIWVGERPEPLSRSAPWIPKGSYIEILSPDTRDSQ